MCSDAVGYSTASHGHRRVSDASRASDDRTGLHHVDTAFGRDADTHGAAARRRTSSSAAALRIPRSTRAMSPNQYCLPDEEITAAGSKVVEVLIGPVFEYLYLEFPGLFFHR